MSDFIYIGATPAEENCEQLGPNYDQSRARLESRTFIEQIRRQLGPEPEGARLRVKSESGHDFGTYYEVVCDFDEEDEASSKYALRCEAESPTHWDDQAKAALGLTAADIERMTNDGYDKLASGWVGGKV